MLGNMESDYGILPYPKFTEYQERYYTPVSSPIALILSCHSNIDAVCIIKEALAVETLNHYDPAYYEQTLQNRYPREEKDLEMLKLITESAVNDLGFMPWYPTVRTPWQEILSTGKTNFASAIEGTTSQAQLLIDELMSFMSENKQ